MNPSFSLPILHSYIPIFDKCVVQSIDHFREKCDKGEFDIKHDVTLVVMNAVLSKSKTITNKIIRFSALTIARFHLDRHNIWQRSSKGYCRKVRAQHRKVSRKSCCGFGNGSEMFTLTFVVACFAMFN